MGCHVKGWSFVSQLFDFIWLCYICKVEGEEEGLLFYFLLSLSFSLSFFQDNLIYVCDERLLYLAKNLMALYHSHLDFFSTPSEELNYCPWPKGQFRNVYMNINTYNGTTEQAKHLVTIVSNQMKPAWSFSPSRKNLKKKVIVFLLAFYPYRFDEFIEKCLRCLVLISKQLSDSQVDFSTDFFSPFQQHKM